MDTIDTERKALIAQIIRYAVTGVGVTLVQSAIYWLGVYPLHLAPLVSHCVASAIAVVVGHQVHSRYSFKGHGSGQEPTFLRFVAVALFGIALNALWVWLLTSPLNLPDWTPILAYLLVTPAIVFVFNRTWVFR
nr:GtrA family protein [Sphingomonas quercus]